jgi:hypothetical protein
LRLSYGARPVGRPIGRFKVDSHEFHCNGIQFLLDIEKPGTRRPPARRSIFLHLQLLITQEKTRGGNCVSGNMSAPRMHIDVP